MATVLPWLPPASQSETERAIARLADSWAERWFIAAPPSRATGESGKPRSALRWLGSPLCAIGAAPADFVLFGLAVVAGKADAGNPRDAELLRELGEAAATDLAAAFLHTVDPDARSVEVAAASLDRAALSYRLSGFAPVSLEIALAPAALVGLRRRLAGRRGGPMLGRFDDALSGEMIRLGCHLGEARLTAGDIACLAKGDLIVLQRGTADRLPLTVEGRRAGAGKATFADQGGGAIVLRIDEAVDFAMGTAV